MKAVVILLIVASVATAQIIRGRGGSISSSRAQGNSLGARGRSIGGNPPIPGATAKNPYGPKVYGGGINNPNAFFVNDGLIRYALSLVQTAPNVLIRVNQFGKVQFTDRYGQEVELVDGFGRELGDLFDN